MKTIAVINVHRDTYSNIDAAESSCTVDDLIRYLQNNFNGDEKIILSNDSGYTYGYITEHRIAEDYLEEYEDDDDDWV